MIPDNFHPSDDTYKTVPHNKDAEEAVIGSVLINPECYYDVAPIIAAKDFYIHKNKWIWEAIVRLHDKRAAVDLLTLSDELEHAGKLAEIGGAAYLTAIMTNVPFSLNAPSYAQVVAGYAARRKYILLANRIATYAYDDAKDVTALPPLIREQLDIVEVSDKQFVHVAKPLADIYDEIEQAESNPREVYGLPTGFRKFDRKTGGIQLGDLVWLMGEPGIGKTWSLTQMALAMSEAAPGALLSMEMSNNSIVRRMLSGMSGIRTQSMRSGIGLPRNWRETFGDTAAQLEALPMFISDVTMTTDMLRVALKQLKRERNIQWFGVDYALLFPDKAENEIVRTEIISRNLKHMCKDFDLAGVVLQSVVKGGMDSSDTGAKNRMRGSGQMIHDADIILSLSKFTPLDEADQAIRESERARMATMWTTKGRELETQPVQHLIRRDGSPFFDEFDPEKLRAARFNQPLGG